MLCSSEELSGMQAEAERPRQQNLAANQQDPGEPTDCSIRQQGYTLTHLHKHKRTYTYAHKHILKSLWKHIKCTLETQKPNKKAIDFYYKTSIMQLFT